MKKRSVLGFNNDSYARAWKEGCGRKVGKVYRGITVGQREGWQTGELSIIRESNFTTSNGFQDPLQRRSFFTSWIWIVLHGSRWERRGNRERFDCSLINYGRKYSKRCGLRIDGFNRSILLN